jgi:HlyD family secretion protein
MKKKIPVLIALVIVIAGVAVYLVTKSRQSIYVGTIEATKVDISPRVGSLIEKIFVDEGAKVEKDSALFSLACEDIRLKKETLDRDYDRAKKLFASGTIPKEGYEHIKAEFDDVTLKLGWCDVKSPLAATVLNKYREPGEIVNAGTKVFTLADLNTVWAYVYVEQSLMSRLKVGDKVAGLLPEQKMKKLLGVITHINNEAEFTPKNVQTREERTRLVYGIKITFDNKDGILKPGMPVEIEFNVK